MPNWKLNYRPKGFEMEIPDRPDSFEPDDGEWTSALIRVRYKKGRFFRPNRVIISGFLNEEQAASWFTGMVQSGENTGLLKISRVKGGDVDRD